MDGSAEASTRYAEAALLEELWTWSLLVNGSANVTKHPGFRGVTAAGPKWERRHRNARSRVLQDTGSEAAAEAVRRGIELDRCWMHWATAIAREVGKGAVGDAGGPLVVVTSADGETVAPPIVVKETNGYHSVCISKGASACLGLGQSRRYVRGVRQREDGTWAFSDTACQLGIRGASAIELQLLRRIRVESGAAKAVGRALRRDRVEEILAECGRPLTYSALGAPVRKRRARAPNSPVPNGALSAHSAPSTLARPRPVISAAKSEKRVR